MQLFQKSGACIGPHLQGGVMFGLGVWNYSYEQDVPCAVHFEHPHLVVVAQP